MTDSDDLQLPPLSARIAHHLARLEARLPDAFAPSSLRPRIESAARSIHREVRPIEKLEDPARMLRLKVTSEPREVARPPETDDALEEATPQFFLRNTQRLEADADPDDLIYADYRTYRESMPWADLEAARRCDRERLEPLRELSSYKIALLVAERRVVMVETAWHELYGRPDELEPSAG